MPHPEVAPAEAQDWRPLLDRELNALPEKYRTPIVLCDLECKSRREAARQLGLVEGTLASRLATGRRMLARRLVRCGLTLSGGALAVTLAEGASAAVPAPLAVRTVQAAALVAAGNTGGVATPVAVLMNEVLRAMLMTKLKVYAAVAVVSVLLGAGGLAFRASGQAPAPRDPEFVPQQAPKQAEGRPLTELELLRKEVDILKLQVEVMQAELRALKGKGGAPAAGPTDAPNMRPPSPARGGRSGMLPPGSGGAAPASEPNATAVRRGQFVDGTPTAPEPEAALKALREHPDDNEVRRRAVEALEQTLQRLKEAEGPGPKTANPRRY
jgi:hypothetical protein